VEFRKRDKEGNATRWKDDSSCAFWLRINGKKYLRFYETDEGFFFKQIMKREKESFGFFEGMETKIMPLANSIFFHYYCKEENIP